MEHQHRHYLVFGQAFVLLSLVVFSQSGIIASKFSALVPALVICALLYISIRMFAAIMRMLLPVDSYRGSDHMHGSLLPVVVFAPSQ